MPSFSDACSMTDYETDSVILTGGDPTYSLTERYGHSGLLETLPALVQGRKAHGCDSYVRHGTRVRNDVYQSPLQPLLKVFLVVGGVNSDSKYLSSTEIFYQEKDEDNSGWSVVSPLPGPAAWAGAVSLNNKIYLFGESISPQLSVELFSRKLDGRGHRQLQHGLQVGRGEGGGGGVDHHRDNSGGEK